MNLIIALIIGGIIGWLASIVMRTDAQQGILLNVVVGIIGSVVGGWIFSFFGGYGVTGFNFYSFGVAFVGACAFLLIAKAVIR